MNSYWRHFILPGLLLVLSVSGLRAQTDYADNTGEATNFSMVVAYFTPFATPFVTDNSASSFSLDNVYFASNGSPESGGGFALDIYTDAGGQPGVSLTGGAGLSGTDDPVVPTLYPYAPTSPITLQPDTEYWVVASISSEFGGDYEWQGTFSNTVVGTWMLPLQASLGGDGWSVLGGDGLKVAITATAVVPEPGRSGALAGLLALGAALRRSGRRSYSTR